jgi:MFS family permease
MTTATPTALASTPPASVPSADAAAPTWKLVPLWLIVALIVSSPVIGASVINAHMAEALKMDRTQLGAGFSLFVAMMSLCAPVVAIGFKRFGIRTVAAAGAALAALGAVLMATMVESGPAYILCYGLVIGLGVGAAGVMPVQTVVASWFRHRRALAVCVVLSAIDVAGIVAAPVFARLIAETGDWRSAWWVTLTSIVTAGLLILWILPRKVATDAAGHIEVNTPAIKAEDAASRVYKSPVSWSVKDAVRTRQYALLMLYSVITAIVWVFFLSHGVKHLQEIGHSATTAASIVSVIVGAQLLGNITAGLSGDRVPPHLIGAASMVMLGAGLALGLSPSTEVGLIAFGVVFGFGYGAGQVCWITALGNYFGPGPFPVLFGIILSAGVLGGIVGGVGAGATFDRLHTYHPALLVGIVLTVTVGLLQLLASPASIRRQAAELARRGEPA